MDETPRSQNDVDLFRFTPEVIDMLRYLQGEDEDEANEGIDHLSQSIYKAIGWMLDQELINSDMQKEMVEKYLIMKNLKYVITCLEDLKLPKELLLQ